MMSRIKFEALGDESDGALTGDSVSRSVLFMSSGFLGAGRHTEPSWRQSAKSSILLCLDLNALECVPSGLSHNHTPPQSDQVLAALTVAGTFVLMALLSPRSDCVRSTSTA